MEWGIKLKNNREDLFKKRFWTLVGKMIISFTIIVIFFMVLKRIIELSDFQWLYNKNNVTYYRAIYTFDLLYYNGYVYVALAVIAIIIFLILLYKEIKSMTSYINVISDSSERLFDGSEEYISLSPEMKELEIKLNHFRSESIKNKKLAEENEKKKDELIVYLAHDIKTPLTVVIGYLSLLDEIEDMPLKQRKKYIELALNKSYRLEELINELFDIARFNSEKIILEKEELNLNIMLEQEFKKDYFRKLGVFVKNEYKHKIIYPQYKDIFNAFRYTDYDEVKVVILGQDPYHGDKEAHGLSFSVQEGVAMPPSLRNIFKELYDDYKKKGYGGK